MPSDTAILEPPKLTQAIFSELEDKAQLPFGSMITLGILAGVYIGFGGLFATIALAQADILPYGIAQALAGLVFSLGLALVLIAGAELFTGNTLMAGPVLLGRLQLMSVIRALGIVYAANLVGAVALAFVVFLADVGAAGNGAVGTSAIDLAVTKLDKSFAATFFSGVLANMLVCLAVWMAYAGQTVTAKLAGLFLPIAAFVAAGLEHSVANMYLLPYAYFVQDAGTDISLVGIFGNLAPATAGNLIGGAIIAISYGFVYRKD